MAELVYGETLRIAGEILASSSTNRNQFEVITELRRYFENCGRSQRRATGPRQLSSTRIWQILLTYSTSMMQYDSYWIRPTAAPKRSCPAQRRRCESP